ncbi:Uncharacterised protein [uncultured archaeon]|nr:Uncharacterised protein [uncultured archaeon]
MQIFLDCLERRLNYMSSDKDLKVAFDLAKEIYYYRSSAVDSLKEKAYKLLALNIGVVGFAVPFFFGEIKKVETKNSLFLLTAFAATSVIYLVFGIYKFLKTQRPVKVLGPKLNYDKLNENSTINYLQIGQSYAKFSESIELEEKKIAKNFQEGIFWFCAGAGLLGLIAIIALYPFSVS